MAVAIWAYIYCDTILTMCELNRFCAKGDRKKTTIKSLKKQCETNQPLAQAKTPSPPPPPPEQEFLPRNEEEGYALGGKYDLAAWSQQCGPLKETAGDRGKIGANSGCVVQEERRCCGER